MKIAFYDPFVGSGIGGVETQIRELAKLFSRQHEVHIITGFYHQLDRITLDLILKHGIKFHFFPFIGKTSKLNTIFGRFLNLFFPFERFKSSRIAFEAGIILSSSLQFFLSSFTHFLRNKYDVIYVSNSICSLISFLTRDPVMYYIGGSGWLPPRLMKRIKKFLVCSNYTQKDFKRLTSIDAKVVPYGIDFKKFRKRKADIRLIKELKLSGATVLVTVGRLSPQKGFDCLLKALNKVKKKNKNFKLLIIGDGEERERLTNLCKQLELENEVTFLGKIFHDRLPMYYHIADIFVLPSLYESFGIVFLEAMAAGLPIVSTNVAAIPEVVNKKVGVLVKPNDEEELAHAILKLINNKKARIRMGREGMKIAKEYDWFYIGKMMLNELKNIK